MNFLAETELKYQYSKRSARGSATAKAQADPDAEVRRHTENNMLKWVTGVEIMPGRSPSDSSLRLVRRMSTQLSTSGSVGSTIIGARVLQMLGGTGLTPMPEPDSSLFETDADFDSWRSEAEGFIDDIIAAGVNINGMSSFQDDLWSMSTRALIDGDAYVIFAWDKDQLGRNGTGMCWSIIPGASVYNPNGTVNSDKIRNGIEYNSNGMAVAIYSVRVYDNGLMKWIRYPIYNSNGVRVIFPISFPGRSLATCDRSLPLLTPIFSLVNTLNTYQSAFITKAAIASKIVGVITHDPETGDPALLSDISDVYGKVETPNEFGAPKAISIDEGTFYAFAKGSKITFPVMQAQGNEYPPIVQSLFAQACASCDISPEIAAKVFGSSFSASISAKGETLKRTLVDRVSPCNVASAFYRYNIAEGIAKKRISAPKLKDYSVNSFQMRRLCGISWGYPTVGAVNPLMEAKARQLAELMGWISKHDNAAAMGQRLGSVNQRRKEAVIGEISLTIESFRDILNQEQRNKLRQIIVGMMTGSSKTDEVK